MDSGHSYEPEVETRGYFIATVTFVLTVRSHYHGINENDFLKLRASLLRIMTPLILRDFYSDSSDKTALLTNR